MRKSFVTWRLAFTSIPTGEQISAVRSLLGPDVRVEKPGDYDLVFREYGMHDCLMIEPEAELTAGEIALNCLIKAHRLGKGWSIMWPGCAKVSEKGWSAEDWRRAAWPEFLEGLHGGFGDSPSFTQSLVPGLHSASFTVTVREEVAQPEMHAAGPAVAAQPVRFPTVDSVEFNSYIQPEINIFLMRNQLYTWSRDVAGARELLEKFGFSFTGEGYEELLFTGQSRTTARIRVMDGTALWTEFILSACHDPHLLEEVEFTKKQDEYETLFHNSVNQVEKFLGAPSFVGASGEAGFPEGQWADWAAVWDKGKCRVMVEVKQNDKEMPIELCLIFEPLG